MSSENETKESDGKGNDGKAMIDFLGKQPEFKIFYFLSSIIKEDNGKLEPIMLKEEIDQLTMMIIRLGNVMEKRYENNKHV